MRVTVSTFLPTGLHFVLARSSIVAVVVLPSIMAFPLIPILAYTLIISAFSYVSFRFFKHFKFNSDLLAFFRRGTRFSPLRFNHSEHELLPTAFAFPLPTPPIGVYPESSNVTIPRASSFHSLPVPPRLISPPSSPPQTRSRPATNRPLASFPVLEPTVYGHKPRRSRSLGVLISRPDDWPSRFPPSPPAQQQGIIDGNDEENIPLTAPSQSIGFAPRLLPPFMHFHDASRTFAPAPMLMAPSMSAPAQFQSEPLLVDVSPTLPVSAASSKMDNYPLSSSSSLDSELSPPPSEPVSRSSSGHSPPSDNSDIAVQKIGGAAGFAYDWGLDDYKVGLQDGEGHHGGGSSELPPPFNGEPEIRVGTPASQGLYLRPEAPHFEYEEIGGLEQEMQETEETPLFDVEKYLAEEDKAPKRMPTETDSQHGTEGENNLGPVSTSSRTSTPSASPIISVAMQVVEKPTDRAPEGDVVAKFDSKAQKTSMGESMGEDLLSLPLPLLVVEMLDMQERPSVFVDTKPISQESDTLSTCPSPLPPSQTPTPPASPPFAPISISRCSSGGGKTKPKMIIVSSASAPASPVTSKENQDHGILHAFETDLEMSAEKVLSVNSVEDATINAESVSTKVTSSPSIVRPEWSISATDAPSLGLDVARAATVEEKVAWPRSLKKNEAEREEERSCEKEADEEPAGHHAVAAEDDQSNKPSRGVGNEEQGPTIESKPSLPGVFHVHEPDVMPAPKESKDVSASSTAVAAARTPRRQYTMRGLPVDVALAMQRRPGFGVGADPAWMARFWMAVFGWFTIMMAGRGGEVDAYTL